MTTNSSAVKNLIPVANKYDRVILLIDMDCFYCQVEEKLNPSLQNQPLAVVQYNAWRGGGIIAVNYAARAKGVTRHMRGDEAREQCPEIQLVKVPNVREKADLTKYREAGKEVASVLQRFTQLLERASVDEAYLDITDAVNKRLQEMNDGTFILQPQELVNTYAVGYQSIGEFLSTITTSFITNPLPDDDDFFKNFNENDVPAVRQSNIRLLIGASIASEIRSAVKAETSYECSAGIAHNKIMAKLTCGINKPNKQTILPLAQIPSLFETLPVGKIKGLGAKFGEEICERLKVRYLGQLLKFTEAELQRKFDEKNGSWLYNICRGIDLEVVTPRFYSKSIGCCKKFPGRNNITGLKTLQHWLNELANEINDRLDKDICENNRRAKQMVVSFIQEFDGEEISSSRSASLQCYDAEMLAKTSLEIIKVNTKTFFRAGSESVLNNPIKFLGISVGKFETISNSQNNIQEMFAQQAAKKEKIKLNLTNETQTSASKANLDVMTEILKEENESNFKSPLLKTINLIEGERNLLPGPSNNSQKQTSKEKSSPKIRSFFLNALNKVTCKENNNSSSTENNYICLNAMPSFDKSELTSVKNTKSVSIAHKKLTTPNERFRTESVDNIPQKSFFAKALQKKETLKLGASNDSSFNIDSSNLSKNTEADNISSNEENLVHSELQNKHENNDFSNNTSINGLQTCVPGPMNQKRKFDKISDAAEANNTDYRSHYAEFAIPELNIEFLQYTDCSKCGSKILNDPISLQSHQDHHYAQELSNQQRNEYRDAVRSKIISSKSPPNNAKNKKSKKLNINKNTSTDITKFLKTSSSPTLLHTLICDTNESPQSSASNMEICHICKLPIKIENIVEHKDFHMAKDLQKKLNQLEVRTVEVVKKAATFDSSRKSVNSSINMSTQQNKVAAKPITQFFPQSDN